MASTKHLLLVLCLGVCVGMCRSWVDDVVQEDPESFSNWALNAFSQILESENNDVTQHMKLRAEDAASRAAETMKSAASGAYEYSSQKATDAKEAIGSDDIIRMPIDTAQDTYENAKQKLNSASDKASNMAHNVCSGNDNSYDMDEVSEPYMLTKKARYEAAKEKAAKDEAYLSTKKARYEAASEKASKDEDSAAYMLTKKARYEAAKEKASEAIGNAGAKMRNIP